MTDDFEQNDASTHTSGRMTTRIKVAARVSGRRRWTLEEKLAVVRDAFGPLGSVREACERHDIGSGQVYTWRRQALSGELTGRKALAVPSFAEVELTTLPAALPVPAPGNGDQIGIELPSGIRLTVDAAIDVEALGRMVAVLNR
jgi:transposase